MGFFNGIKAFKRRLSNLLLGEDEELQEEEYPEVTEYSSLEPKTYRVSAAKEVQEYCEQLVEANRRINEFSKEYKLVTGYLTDIQKIEALPESMADEINAIAARIEELDKERKLYQETESLLSREQYNLIARHEASVEETIVNLAELEQHFDALKNDMSFLEAEKDDLKYMRSEYAGNMAKVRGIVITILIMFLFTCGVLTIFAETTKKSVTLFALVAGVIAVLAFAIAYVYYLDVKRLFSKNEAKLKKAVSLENKVKVKYINNVNTIDYIYDKYGVDSAEALEDMWQQYNTMVHAARKHNTASNNLRRLCDELVVALDRIGVNDSDVWTKQTNALVDRREMVEIKHGLNVRRKKLRENIKTCENIKANSITALKAAIEDNSDVYELIIKQLEPYGLALKWK